MPDGQNGVLENLSPNVNVSWYFIAPPQAERPAAVLVEEQDIPASISTQVNLSLGDVATGTLSPRTDRDWYRVEMTRGSLYQITVRSTDAGNGALRSPRYSVYDATGTERYQLGQTWGDDFHTQIYTGQATGPYYIGVRTDSSAGGDYTVTVERGIPTGDDEAYTAATLAPNSQITSSIENGLDYDWYRITLMAGVRYTISLGGGTLYDPVLSVRDSAGQHITGDNDSGPLYDSLLTYTPATTGVYYLVARTDTVFATGNFRGTYTLNITTTSTADDYAGSASTTGALSSGGSVTGVLERGNDADWFRVSLVAGQTYRVDVQGALSDNGTILRPFVGVVTASAVAIAEVPITSTAATGS